MTGGGVNVFNKLSKFYSRMLVIFGINDRADLLPYFTKYYASIGATHFACIITDGSRNPLYDTIRSYLADYDSSFFQSFRKDGFSPHAESKVANRIRIEFSTRFQWYCVADLDEFYYFSGQNFGEVIPEATARGFDAVHGLFVDRLSKDGTFPPICGTLDAAFPLGSNLSQCFGLIHHKIPLAKIHLKIGSGHHKVGGKCWRRKVEVHHFKWHSGIVDSLQAKYARKLRQHPAWANRVLEMLNAIRGGTLNDRPRLRLWTASKLGV